MDDGTLNIAILGTGMIGIDLAEKVKRSDVLTRIRE